jgi:1-acyl-sn-glycerol-3-phosphate acyltransferase
MFEPIYRLPVLNFIFKTGKAIPIDSQRTAPETYRKAFESVAAALKEGELVCIFPEGKLTENGEIDVFKPGIMRILEDNPVPVVPLALRGLWGSFFSKKVKMSRLSGRFWSEIEVVAGTRLSPQGLNPEKLRDVVKELRGAKP